MNSFIKNKPLVRLTDRTDSIAALGANQLLVRWNSWSVHFSLAFWCPGGDTHLSAKRRH